MGIWVHHKWLTAGTNFVLGQILTESTVVDRRNSFFRCQHGPELRNHDSDLWTMYWLPRGPMASVRDWRPLSSLERKRIGNLQNEPIFPDLHNQTQQSSFPFWTIFSLVQTRQYVTLGASKTLKQRMRK